MRKYPVSTLLRLLPVFFWLWAFAVFVWQLTELVTRAPGAFDGSATPWPTVLLALLLLGLTAFAICMVRKEYKDVKYALKADIPIGFPWRKARREHNEAPRRYPMAEPLKTRAREMLEILQTAGVLQPGEAPFEEFIGCAEVEDEYLDLDIDAVASALHSLMSRRARPFANLTFFIDQVEILEADVIAVVREFARLSGQSQRLGTIRVQGIDGAKIVPARGGEFPPNNAVAEFELDTQRCTVPFVMYYKNIPGGLLEGLAKVLPNADNPRRFVSAYFDSKLGVSYLSAEKTAALNRALSQKLFEPIETQDSAK